MPDRADFGRAAAGLHFEVQEHLMCLAFELEVVEDALEVSRGLGKMTLADVDPRGRLHPRWRRFAFLVFARHRPVRSRAPTCLAQNANDATPGFPAVIALP